jgi:Heterokaryon incompatibility protein (HET)
LPYGDSLNPIRPQSPARVPARHLWVDAICINQADPEEKSYQVGLMGKIYQLAKFVVIWLGEQADGSELLRGLVPALLEAKKKRVAANDERTLLEMTAADWKYYGIPHWTSTAYLAICRLVSRPWFSRVWIIQEISLATNAVVYCGSWNMPWGLLLEVIEFVQEIGQSFFSKLLDAESMHNLQWSRARVTHGVQQDLLSLLLQHRSAQATDPKDKIYALRGLAQDSHIIEVNYSRSLTEIYTDAAMRLLDQGQSLDILSMAHLHDNENLTDLPSWVPDWSVNNYAYMPLLLQFGDEGYGFDFRAAGEMESRPIFKNDGKILGISGLIVDHIVACGPSLPMQPSYDFLDYRCVPQELINRLEDEVVLHHWEKIAEARSRKPYVTGGAILDAYWQTLCAFPQELETEAVKRGFTAYDDSRSLNRWLVGLLLDTLGMDYRNWPYKVLKFIGETILLFFRILRRHSYTDYTFPSLTVTSRGRKMVRTRKGYIGLASLFVSLGDKVGLFQGSKVPLIVQRKGPYWQLLGESYICGMMNGECFVEDKCDTMWFC